MLELKEEEEELLRRTWHWESIDSAPARPGSVRAHAVISAKETPLSPPAMSSTPKPTSSENIVAQKVSVYPLDLFDISLKFSYLFNPV